MKSKILFVILSLSFLLFTTGCKEKEWKSDNLEYTPVLKVTVDPALPDIYYFYTNESFFIHEEKSTLEEYKISDWFVDSSDDNFYKFSYKTIGYNSDDNTYRKFDLIFNKTTSDGKMTINVYDKDSNELLIEQSKVLRVRSIVEEQRLISRD